MATETCRITRNHSGIGCKASRRELFCDTCDFRFSPLAIEAMPSFAPPAEKSTRDSNNWVWFGYFRAPTATPIMRVTRKRGWKERLLLLPKRPDPRRLV